MSYTPPTQDYELGTVWVPMYLNGQLYMIPIRPKPIQPNPIQPKPYTHEPSYFEHPLGGNQHGFDNDVIRNVYTYDHEWGFPPPPDGSF